MQRFDVDAAMLRAKHRFVGNEQMTMEIFYEMDRKQKSVVLDKNSTVKDFLDQIKANSIKKGNVDVLPEKKISKLDTNVVYTIFN